MIHLSVPVAIFTCILFRKGWRTGTEHSNIVEGLPVMGSHRAAITLKPALACSLHNTNI